MHRTGLDRGRVWRRRATSSMTAKPLALSSAPGDWGTVS